jgi:hypothetical protein
MSFSESRGGGATSRLDLVPHDGFGAEANLFLSYRWQEGMSAFPETSADEVR